MPPDINAEAERFCNVLWNEIEHHPNRNAGMHTIYYALKVDAGISQDMYYVLDESKFRKHRVSMMLAGTIAFTDSELEGKA